MIETSPPTVSVVMPVYNALPYLDAAIQSILDQTHSDLEFVILDDASTDGSTERLREWAKRDARIQLIEAKDNLGPAISSDRVARAASHEIVARMDADDISYPDRIARQLAVLEARPDVGVVGGLYDIINPDGTLIRRGEPWRLANRSTFPPFGNGPMTYRHSLFLKTGGYRPECVFWEDQDLLIRMAALTHVLVIPEPIYQVRQSNSSTRFASEPERVERAIDLMFRARGRLSQHRDYEDLLANPLPADAEIDPRVYVSMGSMTLWAGGRPRLLRRLVARGDLRPNFRSLAALVWAAWAQVHPPSLRAFLKLLLICRNLYASAAISTDRPIEWPGPIHPQLERRRTGPVE